MRCPLLLIFLVAGHTKLADHTNPVIDSKGKETE